MTEIIKYDLEISTRLDQFLYDYLSKHLSENQGMYISRSSILKYVNEVRVNGKAAKKGFQLKKGDSIEINIDAISKLIDNAIKLRADLKAEDSELDIIEESRDWMVLRKPKGIVVHPGVGHWSGTLANMIKGYLERKGEYEEGIDRAGIVHRLDKGVSGLMIVAKTIKMQRHLKDQFEQHAVVKVYKAKIKSFDTNVKGFVSDETEESALNSFIANGFNPTSDWIKVEGYIGRSGKDRKLMIFSPVFRERAKYALMYIKPLKNKEILINLKTGRMHQIRATLKYLGYYIQGDTQYGLPLGEDCDHLDLEEILLGCHVNAQEFKYWLL